MNDAGRRPMGRLFYWAMMLLAAVGFGLPALGMPPQGGAPTTNVADTVYSADGTAASGTLIITWPAFVTASGTAVAPGTKNVTLGANGALSVALVPNAGATPAGVYYTVVYQLGAGQVKTEDWLVPTTSPANLAEVRTTPGSGFAAQPASMQYVNSVLGTKANDSAVVHLNGTETISGTKSFANAPSVPAPTSTGQVANKAYVDQSVANVGAGSYLSTAGGTMTGPITLPGLPSSALQATTKGYVDQGFSAKADLITGLVPASELGTGSAAAGSCLLGNGTSAGTWGVCGGGGGTGNVSTAPAASQNVVQPPGTQFSTNNLANARYVTPSWNWGQSPADNLGVAGNNTIHLSPCPLGLDTSNSATAQYYVYISGTGTAEAAPVTGGSCPAGGSGTITVTTAYTHTLGYTVGSANSGIQEAINDAGAWHATITLLPASASGTPNYTVYAPVFLNSRKALLSGYGALVQCFTRTACLIDGNYVGSTGQWNTIAGIEFLPGLNIDGVQIASVAAANGTYTITTATNHPFVTGDYVILFYSNANQTQEGRFKVTVTAANQFTYNVSTSSFAPSASYGWAAIENTAIEDIGNHVTVRDIKLTAGSGQYFHWGIVVGNDQSFKLDGLSNGGSGVIRCTANFCGAMVYARGDQGAAPVVNIDHLEASMQCSGNGVRYAAGNTLHVMNSVVQGFNQYGIYYAGGLQDVLVGGTYEESSGSCYNPVYPGSIGSNVGIITNNDLSYLGDDPIGGQFPAFVAQNAGSQVNNYYITVHSSTVGNMGMFYIGNCLTAGTGSCTIYWPEIDLDGLGTVTYDVLRTVGASAIPPNGNGSYAVATGVSGSCSTAGICTYVDPQTGVSNYTLATAVATPRMNFWPGAVVLGKGAHLHINSCGQAGGIIATSYLPTVYCNHAVPGSGGGYTPYWAVFREGDSVGNNNPGIGAILEQAGPATGSALSGLTGLRGFLNPGGLGQTDMFTFAYSNPFLTLATPGYRPAAAATDTAIGFDSAGGTQATSAQLALRAPVAISEYIGSVFDNGSYKERLTAAAKTFNVPVTINGTLTVTGTCTGCGGGSGGSMTWPSSGGIAVYGGSSAWSASLAAPGSGIVGVSDTQTLTNKTIDGVSPAVMGYLDATSSIQTQLNGKAPIASPTFTGTVTLPVTGSVPQCLHVSSTGAVSGTGSDCGSGGGGGSGTVNSGNVNQVAIYGASGTAVNGDSGLTDNGATLSYSGSGGVSANSGTFSGNLTVGGQLIVSGPWLVDSPIPASAMAAATSGTSSLGISNDGNFYISANAGATSKVLTAATDAVGSVFGRTGAVLAQTGDYSVAQVTGAAPLASPTFTGTVTEPVPALPSQTANQFFAAPNGSAGAPGFRAIAAADIPTLNQNTTGSAASLSGISALPNGTTATTQTAGDSGTKVATTAFATVNFAAMNVSGAVGDYPRINGNYPAPSISDSGVLAGPYAIPWITAVRGGTGATFSQNTVKMWGVVLTFPVLTTYLTYYVVAVDNTADNYDVGIANASGTIVLNIGATAGTSFAPATGPRTLSWTQGTKALQPGKYYVVITTNCAASCATVSADNSSLAVTFQNAGTAGTTSGGALSSFTPPADVWSWGASLPALVVK
ncbi:MAG TPA: hypothetical protein VE377_13130 [Candidatus Dormibacteraeota bacterium]|nr:hypothetical protein [Candidatus Dormibacteraeota bacterium]